MTAKRIPISGGKYTLAKGLGDVWSFQYSDGSAIAFVPGGRCAVMAREIEVLRAFYEAERAGAMWQSPELATAYYKALADVQALDKP